MERWKDKPKTRYEVFRFVGMSCVLVLFIYLFQSIFLSWGIDIGLLESAMHQASRNLNHNNMTLIKLDGPNLDGSNVDDWKNFVQLSYVHIEKSGFRLFVYYFSNKNYYIEWGSGGSTQIGALLVNKKAYSIEHHLPWCQTMQQNNDMVEILMSLNKLQFECIKHNEKLEKWGYPAPQANKKLLGNLYVNRIDNVIKEIKEKDGSFNGKIGAIFIDGRYRVACALKLLIENYICRNESIVMIHDYIGRDYHLIIEKYYDLIDSARPYGSMAVLRPKIVNATMQPQLTLDFEKFISISD